jgi:hypothetical protein
MPASLEYARPESHDRVLVRVALVCSICSGPAAFGLAMLASLTEFSEIVALAVVLGGTFVFACIVRIGLPQAAPPRIWHLVNVAVVAPVAWSIAIVLLLIYSGLV